VLPPPSYRFIFSPSSSTASRSFAGTSRRCASCRSNGTGIIEGVADLKHDTAWSLRLGGKITDQFHRGGLSIDGTSAYLEELVRRSGADHALSQECRAAAWEEG
jgi:hypothetical protein